MRKFGATCSVAHGKKEFTEPAIFEEHMLVAHDAKPGMAVKREEVKDSRGRFLRYGSILGWHGRPGTFKKLGTWRGPKLTEDGKPFEPQGLQPGAPVTWRELVGTGVFKEERYSFAGQETVQQVEVREWTERSGQVWSSAPYPKSAWVVPFELREGEYAVLVREDHLSGSLKAQQAWTRAGYRDVA